MRSEANLLSSSFCSHPCRVRMTTVSIERNKNWKQEPVPRKEKQFEQYNVSHLRIRVFASHLTERFHFIEIIWKPVRSFLRIEPIVVPGNCRNVTYRSSSRLVAKYYVPIVISPGCKMSRTYRHLVQLQNVTYRSSPRSV